MAPKSKAERLRFPVIRRVEVTGYPMYPGEGNGLKHPFQPGINAIVGINGLGKTTLLNILLRAIVGPFDPQKADVQEPGAKLHELTSLKRFPYFASRIGADARPARAMVEISFGSDIVRIVRDLGPKLEIQELWHNKERLDADKDLPYELRYEQLIAEVSGIRSRYDFDFVVRNLLFFLEDKVPLIWNPKGQFEILRILFLDDRLSAETAKLHDIVMQLDSQYRNLLWNVNRLKDEHTKILAKLQSAPDQAMTLEAARKAHEASEEKLLRLESEFGELTGELDSSKARLFAAEQTQSAMSRQLERIEVEYLRRAFPDLPARAELLFGTLLTGGGCPVCGTESHAAAERLHSLIAAAKCPCCESQLGDRDKIFSVAKFDSKRIAELEQQLATSQDEVEKAKGQCRQTDEELTETREALYATQRELADLRHKVRTLESNLPPGNDEFDRLTEGLKQQDRQVVLLKHERGKRQEEYDALLERARLRIAEIADAVVKKFHQYARRFLLEDSQLTYDLHKRAVGQSGPVMAFPSFVLKMSSGAAPTASERHSAGEVSESQKEFVDLAFRMAILDVCADRAGPGMLVIETPEASLDSVFIDRAGRLLRQFASGSDLKTSNVVIASTNLNKENMLGHLLGIIQPPKTVKGKDAVRARIINLLKNAAPTRAYRDNKEEYDQALASALGFEP